MLEIIKASKASDEPKFGGREVLIFCLFVLTVFREKSK